MRQEGVSAQSLETSEEAPSCFLRLCQILPSYCSNESANICFVYFSITIQSNCLKPGWSIYCISLREADIWHYKTGAELSTGAWQPYGTVAAQMNLLWS